MRLLHKRPTLLLFLIWLGSLALCVVAVWAVLLQPWLGVQLDASGNHVLVEATTSPAIPLGREVLRIASSDGESLELEAQDLPENTESFASYAEHRRFFDRQGRLDAILHFATVRLTWLDADGSQRETLITPSVRPPSSLTAMFWFQQFVVSASFMIGCWVLLLRPQDSGARMFAITGLMLFIAGVASAVWASRELAMSAVLMYSLETVNLLAVFLFGCALIAMFANYPRQLVARRYLPWLLAVYLPWYLADRMQWLPGPAWGGLLAMLSQFLLALVVATVQWRLARKHPLERASLRWFLLAVLLGCALFTATYVLPLLLRMNSVLSPGYAFGFFLLMYVGIALGLRRYRLFDIDEWAYRVFLWVAGATAVIALDALLIFTGLTEGASLGLSLLLCGWLYFPFRQWLWRRIVSKQKPNFESLIPELSAIAFTASANEQQTRWKGLLEHIFEPLELKPGEATGSSGISEEGLGMIVPGCGNLPVYHLRYAGRGARLFSTRDAVFAASLSQLLEQIMSGRSNYEQGVAQERLRIGRDLHDNIGARLLKLIHHLRGTPNADIARDAMKDLRTSIAAMDAHPVPLANALADWRAEAGSRCDAASCRLQWKQPEELPAVLLAPRVKAMLESVMREIITNALKHAAPSLIEVQIMAAPQMLRVTVGNNGAIADPLTWKNGYGLRNMRGRLEELGGRLNIASAQDKVQLIAEVPLT